MSQFLGMPAASMLHTFPHLAVRRRRDEGADPPVVYYNFEDIGLQFICNSEDEFVHTIFLKSEEYDTFNLSELPFSCNREQVLGYFGSPSKSGERFVDQILGKFGPWDRFQFSTYTVHVQYKFDTDSIDQITLMQNEVVP